MLYQIFEIKVDSQIRRRFAISGRYHWTQCPVRDRSCELSWKGPTNCQSSIFWVVTHSILEVDHRRFGTVYSSQLQRPSSQEEWT